MIEDIVNNIGDTNLTTFLFFCAAFVLFVINTAIIIPKFKERFGFPFPGDLIIIIISTLISALTDVNEKKGVDIVGEIPTG